MSYFGDREKYKADYYKRNKNKMDEKSRKHYEDNKSKYRERRRRYGKNLLRKAIEGYGGRCLFCGEDRAKGLVFHHVNEDAKEHRKMIGTGIAKYHRWLINNNFPDDIVLLCGTCYLILHRTTNE